MLSFGCLSSQANLTIQEAKLNVAQNDLNVAQAQLDEKQAELDKVQAMYDKAVQEKQVEQFFDEVICFKQKVLQWGKKALTDFIFSTNRIF